MIQPDLLTVAPVAAPALVLARRHLDTLQAEHDRIKAEAEDAGSDGELPHAEGWRDLCRQLRRARETVTTLEAEEVRFGGR